MATPSIPNQSVNRTADRHKFCLTLFVELFKQNEIKFVRYDEKQIIVGFGTGPRSVMLRSQRLDSPAPEQANLHANEEGA